MNTELFLGIIVIILVAAAGVYFYLGRKPSSVGGADKSRAPGAGKTRRCGIRRGCEGGCPGSGGE